MSTSLRERGPLALWAALLLAGCAVPYPVVISGGPFEVPPHASREPLSARGAHVVIVPQAPPNCRFLGLASGVGGIQSQYDPNPPGRYAEFRTQAIHALRNAVAAAGGNHTVLDAEVTFQNGHGREPRLEAVLVRGPALACWR